MEINFVSIPATRPHRKDWRFFDSLSEAVKSLSIGDSLWTLQPELKGCTESDIREHSSPLGFSLLRDRGPRAMHADNRCTRYCGTSAKYKKDGMHYCRQHLPLTEEEHQSNVDNRCNWAYCFRPWVVADTDRLEALLADHFGW